MEQISVNPEKRFLSTTKKTRGRIAKDFATNKYVYFILLPVLLHYFIFCYGPMYGAVIAFKDYSPGLGILGSPWVGLKHFKDFLGGIYFGRIFRNTVLLNVYSIIFQFPAPIILALLLNEIKNSKFKRTIQTITYIPHFISVMVICGIIVDFTSRYGIINDVIEFLGGERTNLLMRPELFRTIYITSNIWQGLGWGSIIYLAALSNIDIQLYEAAVIDGANRWKQVVHVTLPGIIPTIIIMFILRMGSIMNVSFEKIFLLYNPLTYETADVISTFVYRKGLLEFSFSFSSAVGLFNSVINFTFIMASNYFIKKVNETSLW